MEFIEKDFNSGIPLLAIVVPVADLKAESTTNCVDWLQKYTSIPYHLILVESSGNEFRFGKSINAGIERAVGYDIIIGMNDDTFSGADAINYIYSMLLKETDLGYIGANIHHFGMKESVIGIHHVGLLKYFLYYGIKRKAPFYAFRKLLHNGIWRSTWLNQYSEESTKNRLIVLGTMLFGIKHQCWLDMNGFNEDYYLCWSDVDTSFRVLLTDWQIGCSRSSWAFHKNHMTKRYNPDIMAAADLRHFKEQWSKERIKEVIKASKKKQFIENEW